MSKEKYLTYQLVGTMSSDILPGLFHRLQADFVPIFGILDQPPVNCGIGRGIFSGESLRTAPHPLIGSPTAPPPPPSPPLIGSARCHSPLLSSLKSLLLPQTQTVRERNAATMEIIFKQPFKNL